MAPPCILLAFVVILLIVPAAEGKAQPSAPAGTGPAAMSFEAQDSVDDRSTCGRAANSIIDTLNNAISQGFIITPKLKPGAALPSPAQSWIVKAPLESDSMEDANLWLRDPLRTAVRDCPRLIHSRSQRAEGATTNLFLDTEDLSKVLTGLLMGPAFNSQIGDDGVVVLTFPALEQPPSEPELLGQGANSLPDKADTTAESSVLDTLNDMRNHLAAVARLLDEQSAGDNLEKRLDQLTAQVADRLANLERAHRLLHWAAYVMLLLTLATALMLLWHFILDRREATNQRNHRSDVDSALRKQVATVESLVGYLRKQERALVVGAVTLQRQNDQESQSLGMENSASGRPEARVEATSVATASRASASKPHLKPLDEESLCQLYNDVLNTGDLAGFMQRSRACWAVKNSSIPMRLTLADGPTSDAYGAFLVVLKTAGGRSPLVLPGPSFRRNWSSYARTPAQESVFGGLFQTRDGLNGFYLVRAARGSLQGREVNVTEPGLLEV